MSNNEDKIIEIVDLIKEVSFFCFKKSFPKFKKIGLHPGQIMILKNIENQGTKQKELVEKTLREKATITKALQRLEKSGFITRETDAFDKRKTLIYLTNKGKEVLKEYQKLHEDEIKYLSGFINNDEIDTLLKILHKIKIGLNMEENK